MHAEELAEAVTAWRSRHPGDAYTRSAAGNPFHITQEGDGAIRVVDHLGVVIFGMVGDGRDEKGEFYLAPHYDAPELMPLFLAEVRRVA